MCIHQVILISNNHILIMCKDLKRLSYGEIQLGSCKSGEWRYLNSSEASYCVKVIQNWKKTES